MPDMSMFDEVRRRRAEKESHSGDLLGPIGIALGAGIGFMLGGPPGALAGAKIGSSVGGIGEGAKEGTLTPGSAIGGVASGAMSALPFFGGANPPLTGGTGYEPTYGPYDALRFDAGGPVPNDPASGMIPEELATLLAGLDQQANQLAGPAPAAPELLKPGHPTWEMLAQVIPQVVSQLPPPRKYASTSTHKTIGAWAPALATAATLPTNIMRRRREDSNAAALETYEDDLKAHRERVSQAGKDLRGWALRDRTKDVAKPDRFSTLIPEPVRKHLKVPDAIKTYGEWDELQQATTEGRLATQYRETQDAKVADAAAEDEEIAQLAEGIANLRIRPSQVPIGGRSSRFGARVRVEADKRLRASGSPYTFAQLNLLEESAKKFQGTMDSARMVNWRAQAVTVSQHLEQLKEFYDKWADDYQKSKPNPMVNPGGFALWNRGLLAASREGLLGKKAQEEVGPLNVTKDFLTREVTNVMAGGFAPFESDAAATANDAVTLALSPKATRKTVDALDRLVAARINNNTGAVPFFGKNNPYLADVSPIEGWNEGKRSWAEHPGMWSDLSDVERFNSYLGKGKSR